MVAEKPIGGTGLAHLWGRMQAFVTDALADFSKSGGFDFDNPPDRTTLEYSYTEAENPSVYTEYWKTKADGSIYATRTSTANANETQWTVVTVCEALGIRETVIWAEQSNGTWKEM